MKTFEIEPITLGTERGTNANGAPRGRICFTVSERDLERFERLMDADGEMKVCVTVTEDDEWSPAMSPSEWPHSEPPCNHNSDTTKRQEQAVHNGKR